MIALLVYALVACLVLGFFWWLVDYVPVPGPFNRIAKVVLMVAGLILLIDLLLALVGHPFIRW